MKKKIQVVKNVKTREELNKFLTPDFDKVLVLNIYDDFWGACEVAEPLIKRFQEDPMNLNRVEWVSVDRSIAGDLIPKGSFGSKPKYFLFVVSIYIILTSNQSI